MKKRLFLIPLSLLTALGISLFVACDVDDNNGNQGNTISFVIDVADYNGEGVEDKTVKTGESFTLPEAPSIQYYEFDYWKLGEDQYDVGDSYKVEKDGDLTFTAVYAETYVLTYSVAEGLTAPAQASGRVGAEIDLAAGADNGYSLFVNWVIGGKTYASGAKYTPVHGANVATAAYSDTYVVSFDVGEGLDAPEAKSGTVGGKIELPEAPEKEDYEFEGWLIGGTLYQAGDEYSPVLGATTATAQYKLAYIYVTFAKDEGVIGDLPSQALRVKVDTEIAAENIPELTAPEFYEVVWYNGEEAVTEFKFNENVTLTAKLEYVGSDAAAFIFVPVGEEGDATAYTVMASDNAADYIVNNTLALPVKHNGLPVVGIADGTSSENAFGGVAVRYVYVPASYTLIGDYAFYNNTSITMIIYEEGSQLETVGGRAFYGATSLTTINDSAENAGLHFPASVKKIGAYAFYGVSKSKREVNIFFDVENGQLETIETYAFAATGQNAAGASGFILNTAFPASLKVIGVRAFYCNVLGRIEFADNATINTIGEHAFSNTGSLDVSTVTSVIIPKSVTTLGNNIFQNSLHLAYVEFEEGSSLTEIPERTFSGCKALEEVVFPANLTSLGAYVFEKCFASVNDGKGINLNGGADAEYNLVLPAGVTSYGASVFSGSVFNTITVPANYTKVDASAFSGCVFKGIVFEETAAGADVVPLTIGAQAFSSDKAFPMDLAIPARVTSIGARAFWKVDIKSLTFADGNLDLTLEDYAFNAFNADAGKSSLSGGTGAANVLYAFSATDIALPARLVKLGAGAFQGQAKIKNVTFATGIKITEISDYAFAYCNALTSVDVPEGITTIGTFAYALYATAFGGTSALNIGTYDGTLNSNGSSTVTNTKIEKTDFATITKIVIPASVTNIKEAAYYNRGLYVTSVEFKGTSASGDLTVGDRAFGILADFAKNMESSTYTNTLLTSVTLPANLVEIAGAFRNAATCLYSNLTTVNFAEGSRVKVLGTAFMAYSNMTSFTVPATVEEIGNQVFLCSTLSTLTFAEGIKLKKIGDEAFSNTMPANGVVTAANQRLQLVSVTIPASVEEIGLKAFAGVATMTAINVATGNLYYESDNGVLYSKGENAKLVMYPYGKTDTEYKIKDGVKIIGDHAFSGNKNIKKIDFNNVTIAEGENAFSNTALTEVNHSFVSLGKNAFTGSALVTANINITGEVLPTYLFSTCKSLKTVTLGSGFAKNLPDYTFNGCEALENLTINATLTSIGSNAFSGCKKLTFDGIDFSHVTLINGNAFQNCNELANITLGAISNIPTNAFANTKITSLTLTNTSMVTIFVSAGSSADTTAFTGLTGLTIYVPENLVSVYLADTNWQLAMTKGHVAQIVAIPTEEEGGEDKGDENGDQGGETGGAANGEQNAESNVAASGTETGNSVVDANAQN